MSYPSDKNRLLFEEAKKYIPGGVNSPVRAFGLVEGDPLFVRKAKGSLLYDEEGTTYIDFVGSWGPMISGHAHPKIVEALQARLPFSTSFGAPTKEETQLAKLIVEMVPHAEKVRLMNSGTEATMTALRLARGYTGRDKVLKFEGCYHGHSDAFLVKAGSGATTVGQPASAGVPKAVIENTVLARYNDLEQVADIVLDIGYDLAAIIIEPVAGNMGCIPPKPGFLRGLRSLCDQFGIVLIFDEVMTGFRLSTGGAAELYQVRPDLQCFGKIIGGGLPVGALTGHSRIMRFLAPEGPVYQAGTLSGNPLAVAAGYAQLQILNKDKKIYDRLEHRGQILEDYIKQLGKEGYPIRVNRVGSMISIFFAEFDVKNYDDALRTDIEQFKHFFHLMLHHRIYLPPSPYETWFIADSLTDEMLNKTLEVIRKSVTILFAEHHELA